MDFPQLKVVMAHSGRPFSYDKAFYLSRPVNNCNGPRSSSSTTCDELFPSLKATLSRVVRY